MLDENLRKPSSGRFSPEGFAKFKPEYLKPLPEQPNYQQDLKDAIALLEQHPTKYSQEALKLIQTYVNAEDSSRRIAELSRQILVEQFELRRELVGLTPEDTLQMAFERSKERKELQGVERVLFLLKKHHWNLSKTVRSLQILQLPKDDRSVSIQFEKSKGAIKKSTSDILRTLSRIISLKEDRLALLQLIGEPSDFSVDRPENEFYLQQYLTELMECIALQNSSVHANNDTLTDALKIFSQFESVYLAGDPDLDDEEEENYQLPPISIHFRWPTAKSPEIHFSGSPHDVVQRLLNLIEELEA